MSAIGRLFGRSPFGLLQRHMGKVAQCVAKMEESLEAFHEGRWERVNSLAEEVSLLEHQADEIKNDIRNHLVKRLFLPVERSRVLEILAIQDSLADRAEDVCVLLTLKQLETPPAVMNKFPEFLVLNTKAFRLSERVIGQLDELIESGFGGAEAEKVRNMVHEVAYTEHQVDLVQRELVRGLFASGKELSHQDFYLWLRLIEEVASLSNRSENLANRVLEALELK